MADRKRGIHELYAKDPVAADDLVWGRKADPITRRGFLTKGGLAAMSAAVGASIPFAHLMPGGLIPAAIAQTGQPFEIPGKEGLIILNDRPVNAETPAHLLDDDVTPAKYLFVRNNGNPPNTASIDPDAWTLEIGGESAARSMTVTVAELKKQFRHYTYQLQLECGGNGPSASASGCSRFRRYHRRCGLCRLLRSRHPCQRRPEQGTDLAWRPGRQGDGRRKPDRLGHER